MCQSREFPNSSSPLVDCPRTEQEDTGMSPVFSVYPGTGHSRHSSARTSASQSRSRTGRPIFRCRPTLSIGVQNSLSPDFLSPRPSLAEYFYQGKCGTAPAARTPHRDSEQSSHDSRRGSEHLFAGRPIPCQQLGTGWTTESLENLSWCLRAFIKCESDMCGLCASNPAAILSFFCRQGYCILIPWQ